MGFDWGEVTKTWNSATKTVAKETGVTTIVDGTRAIFANAQGHHEEAQRLADSALNGSSDQSIVGVISSLKNEHDHPAGRHPNYGAVVGQAYKEGSDSFPVAGEVVRLTAAGVEKAQGRDEAAEEDLKMAALNGLIDGLTLVSAGTTRVANPVLRRGGKAALSAGFTHSEVGVAQKLGRDAAAGEAAGALGKKATKPTAREVGEGVFKRNRKKIGAGAAVLSFAAYANLDRDESPDADFDEHIADDSDIEPDADTADAAQSVAFSDFVGPVIVAAGVASLPIPSTSARLLSGSFAFGVTFYIQQNLMTR